MSSQHLWPRLQAEPALEKVLTEIEIPLIPVLARMEQAGVLIDGKILRQQSSELAKRMLELEKQIYDLILKVVFLKNRVKGILRLNQLV